MLRRAVVALTLLSDLGSMNKIYQLKGYLQVHVWHLQSTGIVGDLIRQQAYLKKCVHEAHRAHKMYT